MSMLSLSRRWPAAGKIYAKGAFDDLTCQVVHIHEFTRYGLDPWSFGGWQYITVPNLSKHRTYYKSTRLLLTYLSLISSRSLKHSFCLTARLLIQFGISFQLCPDIVLNVPTFNHKSYLIMLTPWIIISRTWQINSTTI